MISMRSLTVILLSLTCVPAVVTPEALSALQPEKHEMIQRGQVSYRLYCQNCHGESGKGDGPMARLLKVAPADLTLISTRSGGRFPDRRIYETILGSREVRGHGQREMPIWGDAFTPQGDRVLSDAKINEIVEYLKSIQAEHRAEGQSPRSQEPGFRTGN